MTATTGEKIMAASTVDDAGLGVGHVWTNVRCPAYASLSGADCTCNRCGAVTSVNGAPVVCTQHGRHPGEHGGGLITWH